MLCPTHASCSQSLWCNSPINSRFLLSPSRESTARLARRCHLHRRHVPAEASRPDDGSPEPAPSTSSVPDYLPSGAQDWREFRAKLVASGRSSDAAADMWAHHVPVPEEGCLLIAHPLMFANAQEYFAQAVILVFSHDEMGSAGLILNRPTEHRIGDIPGAEELCPGFADMMLYLGGDVGGSTFHILHSYHDLKNAHEIMRGVSMGGFEAAKAGLESGELAGSNVKCFTRYSGWGPGQLARECKAGVWLTAAASSSFVLQQGQDGEAMWHQALELMDGEFAGLSRAMKGETLPGLEPGPDQQER